MNRLAATLMVPDWVQSGLSSGLYERVGGVVRDSGNKQVVAWLREFDGSKLNASVPGIPLVPIGSALNLGIASVSFAVLNYRLNEIEEQLKQSQALLQKIDHKIDLSFHTKFHAALSLAVNAANMSNLENRRQSALTAIANFREVEHAYLNLLDGELDAKSPVVGKYINSLALLYVAEARCYLEIEEPDLALQWFPRWRADLQPRIRRYVEILLTSNPAAFLDLQFKDQIDLSRLTRVYQWLDPSLNENLVFELLRKPLMNWPRDRFQSSGYKWVNALPPCIVTEAEVQGSIWGNREQMGAEAMKRLPSVMGRMESMIEVSQRFDGYELEVQSLTQMKMSFQKWQQLAPPKNSSSVEPELMCILPPKPLVLV